MSLRQDFSQKLTSFTSWVRALSLQESLKQAWVRFPLSILSLVVLTVCLLLMIHFSIGPSLVGSSVEISLFTHLYPFYRFAVVSAIGVVLFAAIRLYWEMQQDEQKSLLIYYVAGLIILGLIF